MTSFLTMAELRELIGLTASAKLDAAALCAHERSRLVALTEKASDYDLDEVNEALDQN